MTKKSEALRLADVLDHVELRPSDYKDVDKAAAELRRLHALNGELLEALRSCLGMLKQANCSTGYCCCGSSIDSHTWGDGHGPVDEGEHYQLKAIEAARAAIAKAEGEKT
jgi:hypothetical protein